jgi:hypothetical protein
MAASMTPPIKPRGHEPVSGRRTFPLSQIRVAAGQAIAEGKSIVTTDSGVLVLSYHPLSRVAPNAEGDGWPLDFDLSDTHDEPKE